VTIVTIDNPTLLTNTQYLHPANVSCNTSIIVVIVIVAVIATTTAAAAEDDDACKQSNQQH
jgi:hypothetical protein